MVNRSVPPQILQFEYPEFPVIESLNLDNGVKINIIKGGNVKVCRIDIIIRGGITSEPAPLTAQMMLAMLSKGTTSRTAAEIAELLDFNGTWYGFNVTPDFMTFTLLSPIDKLNYSLEVITDILLNPTFPKEEFDVLKQRIAQENEIANERTAIIANNRFKELYFGNTPLGRTATKASIESVTLEDVRNLYLSTVGQYNYDIIFAGDISDEDIAHVAKAFSIVPLSCKKENNIIVSPVGIRKGKEITIEKADATQSSILMAISAPEIESNDYIGMKILTYLLGGFFGSRLNMTVREEKGFTYGIIALIYSGIGFSCLQVKTECNVEHTHDCINAIKEEFRKLIKVEVEEEEFSILKSELLSDAIKSIDSTFDIAEYIVDLKTKATDVDYFNKYIKTLATITPTTLRQLAAKYLNPDEIMTVIVTPKIATTN